MVWERENDPFADLVPHPRKGAVSGRRRAPIADPFSDLVPTPFDPSEVSAALPMKDLMALAENSDIPLPRRPTGLPRSAVPAQPSDATRVTLGPAPEPSPTVGPARSSPIAFSMEPGTRQAAELKRRADRRQEIVRGLESTLPGALVGGENQLAAAEGFVQAGSLPARLLNQGVARLVGRENPLPATPAESAAELAQAGMLPESKRLPFSGVTRHAGLETRRDVAGLVGSLPGLTPVFRAAGAVVAPAADVLAQAVASHTRSAALSRLLSETAREAGTVGLAMGAQADAEALSRGRSPDEALTEGVVAGLQGAALGSVFGAAKPGLHATRDALAQFLVDQAAKPPRPRVGNVADLPKRPAVDAEGRPIPSPEDAARQTDASQTRTAARQATSKALQRLETGGVAPERAAGPLTPPRPAVPPVSEAVTLRKLAGEDTPATHTVTFSDGRKVGIRYRVVDLADLQASHDAFTFQKNPAYPEGVQGRDYAADLSAQDVVKTRAQQLDPDLALDPSLSPDKGPPVITPEGVIVAGNERSMLLRRAAELAPERYAAYIKALEERLPEDVKASGTPRGRPVLVREIVDASLDTRDPETLRQLNRASDVSDTKTMRGLDDAASRATQMRQARSALAHFTQTIAPDESLADYLGGADGRTFVRQLVEDGVLSPQELARHVEPRSGALTEEGRLLIRRTMLAATMDDPGVFARVPPSILAKLEPAVPHLIGTRGSPEWDISSQVQGALDVLAEAKEKGLGVEELLAQVSAFEEQVPEAVANMARFLTREPKKVIVEQFRRYQALAQEAETRSGTEDMFEDLVPTPEGSRMVFADLIPRGEQADLFKPPEAVQASLFAGQPETSVPVAGETMRQARRVLEDPREQMLAKQGTPSQVYKEALAFTRRGGPIRADEAAVRPEAVRGEGEEPAGERPMGLFGDPVASRGRTTAPESRADPVAQAENPASAPYAPVNQPTPLGAAIRRLWGWKPLSLQATTEVQTLQQITAALAESVDRVSIRAGRLPSTMRGFFQPGTEAIRMQREDMLGTAGHEIGHYVSWKYLGNPTQRRAFKAEAFRSGAKTVVRLPIAMQRELGRYGKLLYGTRKPTGGYREEGIAEWARYFVIDPARNAQHIPNVVAFLEGPGGILDQEPHLKAALLQARADYARWLAAPARARVAAMLSVNERVRNLPTARSLTTTWIDDLHEFQRAVEELGPVEPTKNAYTLARLMRGVGGMAENVLEFGMVKAGTTERVTPSLVKTLERIPARDVQAFREYLVAESALERHSRGIDPGISVSDAQAIVAEDRARFQPAAEAVWQHGQALIDYRRDMGLLTPEEAEQIKRANQKRIGFYRVFEPDETVRGAGGTGKAKARSSSGVLRQTGSGRRIIDPLESIIKDTVDTLKQAGEHHAATELIKHALRTEGGSRIAEEVPAPQRMVRISVERVRRQLEELGFTREEGAEEIDGAMLTAFEDVWSAGPKEGKDLVLPVLINGERRWFQLKDPRLFEAVKSISPREMPTWLRVLSVPTKILRAGATLTLEFAIARNPIRDAWHGAIRSQGPTRPPGWLQVEGLFHLWKKDDLYHRWVLEGGENATLLGLDRGEMQAQLKRLFATRWGKAVHLVTRPIDTLRLVSSIFENITRLGEKAEVEARLRGRGMSPKDAGVASTLAARDISTDFAKAGTLGRAVNQIVEFFNANLQGTRNLLNDHRTRPETVIPRALLWVTLPSLALYFLQEDDPEYRDTPDWVKAISWVYIQRGTDRGEGWDGYGSGKVERVWYIPKPFEWGILYGTVPERVASWLRGHDPDGAQKIASDMTRAFVPPYLPAWLKVPVELWANKSFFRDRPIVPRSQEGIVPAEQVGYRSGEAARLVGRGLGVSPAKIEHAVTGLTGGLGRYGVQAADAAVRGARNLAGAPPIIAPSTRDPRRGGLAELPGAKALVRNPVGKDAESIQHFYRLYDAAERQRATWKRIRDSGEEERADSYLREHEDEIALVVTAEEAGVSGPLRQAYQQITKLQQQDRQATSSAERAAIASEMRRIATEAVRQVWAGSAEARP